MRILSFIGSLGFQCGYVGQTATQSRPLVSHDVCTGLTSSGNFFSLAKRFTLRFLPIVILSMAFSGSRKTCFPSLSGPGMFVLTGMNSGVLLSSGVNLAWLPVLTCLAYFQTMLSRLAVITSR